MPEGVNLSPAPRDSAISIVLASWFVKLHKVVTSLVYSISADNGDSNITLTQDTSALTQRFNTALTTNRTITLNTSKANRGARFRIVRESGATGGSTLDVGGLKSLAVSEWADVEFSGSAWILTGYGSL